MKEIKMDDVLKIKAIIKEGYALSRERAKVLRDITDNWCTESFENMKICKEDIQRLCRIDCNSQLRRAFCRYLDDVVRTKFHEEWWKRVKEICRL